MAIALSAILVECLRHLLEHCRFTKRRPSRDSPKEREIPDADLWKAAELANRGSVDADLGAGVFKLRLARPGEGKSGGFRTILVLRRGDIAVYLYGYEKRDRANIHSRELHLLQRLAQAILGYNETQIAERVEDGDFIKIAKPEEENAKEIPH